MNRVFLFQRSESYKKKIPFFHVVKNRTLKKEKNHTNTNIKITNNDIIKIVDY